MTNFENTKTCPYCAETIQANAVKCRYCHSFLGAKFPAEEPADRVTYVLDRGLIRFAKFTIGVLAIFSVVGVFLFGFDLKTIRKQITNDRKVVETARSDVEAHRALTMVAASAAAEDAKSTEALLLRARTELSAIQVTHVTLKTEFLQLTADQEERLARRKADEPKAFERKNLWPVGHTLRVLFLEGTAEQIAMVKRQAQKWEAVANLNFSFVDSGPSDIRIAFGEFDGGWSYVGTQSLAIGNDQATMNLGWLDSDGGNVLHEFGHVMGFLHEHQNPLRTFEWDRQVVKKELSGPPNNWQQSQIENSILGTWPEGSLSVAKEYDERSIMHYPFSAVMFKDKQARGGRTVLSEKDKVFAAMLYPRD